MKAVQIHSHGSTDVLKYEDVCDPVISSDEVLISVKATSVNHLDLFVRRGSPGIHVALPHILGSDAGGVIIEKGSNVENLSIGDRVVIDPSISCNICNYCIAGETTFCKKYRIMGESFQGAYASLLKMPARNCIVIPEDLSFTDVAAIGLTLITAWRMMIVRGKIQAGEDVLIIGGGSGVGVLCIQIAKLAGARVFTTASSEEKCKQALSIGADHVLNLSSNSNQISIEKWIKESTSKKGVDVVVDYIGKDTWQSSLKSLKNGGRLLTCGATSGYAFQEDLRHIFFRQLSIIGSTMGNRNDLEKGLDFLRQGKIKPIIHEVLSLKDAKKAHQLIEDRKVFGKIVLVPE